MFFKKLLKHSKFDESFGLHQKPFYDFLIVVQIILQDPQIEEI